MNDSKKPHCIQSETDITDLFLENRNLLRQKDVFLNTDFYKHTYNPLLIHGIDRAVNRILEALSRQEKIAVFSDYDCDGIPGMVVLSDFFKKIEYPHVLYYTPHRHKEGYGLNVPAIDRLIEQGVSLMITVDLGITNIEEVAYCQKKGVDVIVTDHHLPHSMFSDAISKEVLPDAYQVINTKKQIDTYPEKMLCGCATVWKLVSAMLVYARQNPTHYSNDAYKKLVEIPVGWEKWLLDMVGISTIADMVPLVGENRVLAKYGLLVLRKSRRPGLLALFRRARINQQKLTEDDIAFGIAPRLNAASRMDSPEVAFRLLATDDPAEAEELAYFLDSLNTHRKDAVGGIMKDVYKTLEQDNDKEVLVVGNPTWTPGVLGLIASKILDTYTKPVFVWGAAEQVDQHKGSCRSDGSVNLVDLMRAIDPAVFVHMGGHELAGGFSLRKEYVHVFEDLLIEAYKKVKKEMYVPSPRYVLDGELPLSFLRDSFIKKLEVLAPFGIGNEKPTFLFSNVEIISLRYFGKDKNHLELIVSDVHGVQEVAFGYFMSVDSFEKKIGKIEVGMRVNIIGQCERSLFGIKKIKIRIIDFA